MLRSAAVVLVLSSPLMAVFAAEPAPPPEREKVEPRTFPPDPVPGVAQDGTPIRTFEDQGFKLELDLSPQVISVFAPERVDFRDKIEAREGDTVEVIAGNVLLRSGQQTVASLRKGQRLRIHKVQQSWLGTAVRVNGQQKTGWIQRNQTKFVGAEDTIHPTLGEAISGKFVSAAVLTQKSKQFDDGLYAVVELAAQQGAGTFAGKIKLLKLLAGDVSSQPPTRAAAVLLAGLKLAGQPVQASPPLQALAGKEADVFLADPLRSKPLGFYTWNRELTAIFQQDRMLQTELTSDEGVVELSKALQSHEEGRKLYDRYLKLVSRLTNPLTSPDLRSVPAGDAAKSTDGKFRIFPPSRSHEGDLVMKLYADKPIPAGFDLMNELIARIRSGDIALAPTPESGWYDHQTYSLEPLIKTEGLPESTHLNLADEYRKLLTELFKGALALARETHVKQLEVPAPSEAAPPPEERKKVFVPLELSAEPLPTHYLRRADSYRFVRGVLEEAFGPEALNGMRRQTAGGPVETPLSDELAGMESLFRGAALTVSRQLGLKNAEIAAGETAPADAETFLKWAATLGRDPDLSRDARMMVPVFYDRQRKLTKVWVFLGWSQREVSFHVQTPPAVKVTDKDGNAVPEAKGPEVHFNGRYESLTYPVMAEVYVSQLLNRDEFRQHCDTYRTRSAILSNLR